MSGTAGGQCDGAAGHRASSSIGGVRRSEASLRPSVTRALRGRARGSARIFLRGPVPSPSVLRVRNGQNGALIVVFEEARVLSFDGLNEKSLFSVIARIKRPLLGYEKCPILHI